MSGTVPRRVDDFQDEPRQGRCDDVHIPDLVVGDRSGTVAEPKTSATSAESAVKGSEAPSRRFASADRGHAPGGAANPEAGRLKERMIRDAVEAITRRQTVLDSPPAGAMGNATSAVDQHSLVDRLRGTASLQDGQPMALSPHEPRGLDPEASEAFETLGRDLRMAMQTLDLRIRSSGAIPASDEPPLGARHVSTPDPRGATAPAPPVIPGTQAQFAQDGSTDNHAQTAREAAPASQALWADVKALLDRVGSGSALETLDRRMEELASKVEQQLDVSATSSFIEDLSRRIEALQVAANRPSDEPGLEHLVRAIEDRLVQAREASVDIEQLETVVNGFARRIDDSRQQPDAGALSALQAQVERLGERLERSEASLTSLDAVEHSLRDLFSQLAQTRRATVEAAEGAARTAARDTLRAAINNPSVIGASDARPDLSHKVAQDIQDLKLSHHAAERRTQDALAELHQAVETLMERLGSPGGQDSGRAARLSPEHADIPMADPVAPAASASLDGSRPDLRLPRQPPEAGIVDVLIEPGNGRIAAPSPIRAPEPIAAVEPPTVGPQPPDVRTPLLEAAGSSSFIAAARRAAQAAQASAASRQQPSPLGDAGSSSAPIPASMMAMLEATRRYLALRRRPILLSLAGLVLMLGALEAANLGMDKAPSEQTPVASLVVPTPPPPAKAAAPEPDAASAAPAKSTINANSSAPPTEPPPGQTGPHEQASGQDDAAKATTTAGDTNPFLAGVVSEGTKGSEGLKALALKGDPAAQYELGLRYMEGRSVARDLSMATSLLEKAAASGLAPAQYRLGSAYEKGLGEPRDPAQAVAWYSRAVEAGNIRAMHNLAVMSAEGALGKPDYAKAAALFSKAAALGVHDSQFNLAILYARGLGIEQNLAQSYSWFAIAAAQGDDDAAKKRDDVAARLDAKTLDSAKAVVAAFRPVTPLTSANDVVAPPGGWDAPVPPTAAKPVAPAPKKVIGAKTSVM